MDIGTRVRFKHIAVRDWNEVDDMVFWDRIELDEVKEGIVVGLRTFYKGRIVKHSDFIEFDNKYVTYNTWKSLGSYPIVIVTTHIRKKFIYCHLKDVEVIENERPRASKEV